MKKTTSIIWGIALVAIGVVLGLNAFGVTDIELFFDGWWTLFIIVPSAVGLFREKDKTGAVYLPVCEGLHPDCLRHCAFNRCDSAAV